MISVEVLQGILGVTAGLPVLSLTLLTAGIVSVPNIAERRVHQMLAIGLSLGFLTASFLFLGLLFGLFEPFSVDLGRVLSVGSYHFDILFHLDLLGAMFLWLTMALVGLVGAFSLNYLHQDEGFFRFYWLLLAFVIGLETVALGEGLDLIFVGWELLGISSALLIAFFIRRPEPVENGLRAFAVYRFTDVGLLGGIVTLHHFAHTSSIAALGQVSATAALWVGGLLIFGAMGKGAIVPFTSWLPRAMEGPTPSSAIFYGALSIHASPFLLLRTAPVFEHHLPLQIAVFVLGLITALHASMVGRVQTDIKTSLAYAAVAQVGIMWMWIGLGLYQVAIVHLFGHSILRTWQLLRAPSLLHERHQLLVALGADIQPTGRHLERLFPEAVQRVGYRVALERWYLDEMWAGVVGGVLGVLRSIDGLDQRWACLLGGGRPVEPAGHGSEGANQ
jgi:NAD(P)H-quinone oxidoreductase subunit 5